MTGSSNASSWHFARHFTETPEIGMIGRRGELGGRAFDEGERRPGTSGVRSRQVFYFARRPRKLGGNVRAAKGQSERGTSGGPPPRSASTLTKDAELSVLFHPGVGSDAARMPAGWRKPKLPELLNTYGRGQTCDAQARRQSAFANWRNLEGRRSRRGDLPQRVAARYSFRGDEPRSELRRPRFSLLAFRSGWHGSLSKDAKNHFWPEYAKNPWHECLRYQQGTLHPSIVGRTPCREPHLRLHWA
jgi:hypothetical protein